MTIIRVVPLFSEEAAGGKGRRQVPLTVQEILFLAREKEREREREKKKESAFGQNTFLNKSYVRSNTEHH